MFIQDWKDVLKKAWSIRLSLLAAFCGGAEVLLSLTDLGLPRGVFLTLSVLFSVATPIARLVAQKDLK